MPPSLLDKAAFRAWAPAPFDGKTSYDIKKEECTGQYKQQYGQMSKQQAETFKVAEYFSPAQVSNAWMRLKRKKLPEASTAVQTMYKAANEKGIREGKNKDKKVILAPSLTMPVLQCDNIIAEITEERKSAEGAKKEVRRARSCQQR